MIKLHRRRSRVRCWALAFTLMFSVPLWSQDSCHEPPPLSPPNRKVVISDLHLGSGGLDGKGAWNPLEDFRFAQTFERFLKQMGKAGNTDLIIAGDFIDFWQILPELDEARPPDWGSLEGESFAKLEVALEAHREAFRALGQFARRKKNRLIIVPGNHDIDLFWPRVQARLRKELGLNLQQLFFVLPCYESQRVHIEHGHQQDEANWFIGPTAPFVTIGSTTRLLTNWGTVFMSRFYNEVEKQREFIDNLYPELAAIALAFESESATAFTLPHAGRFIVMLARDQRSLDRLGFYIRTLGPSEQPESVPEKNVENLLVLYENADPQLAETFRRLLEDEQRRAEASLALESFGEDDWRSLQAGIVRKPHTLRAVVGIDPNVQAARKIVVKRPEIWIVVMGHTHEIDREEVTRLPDVGPEDRWYVNTGCWQKSLSVDEAKQQKAWVELDLEDPIFPLRFSYVLIEYEADGTPKKPIRSFWE